MAYEEIISKLAEINPALASAIQKSPWILPTVVVQIIMKLIFYPIALYTSAKKHQKAWFVALLICFLFLNDFGLLPILYLVLNKETKATKIEKSKKKKL